MTVTRPPVPDNKSTRGLSPRAIRGVHAVVRLMLAVAALVTAVTGLLVVHGPGVVLLCPF